MILLHHVQDCIQFGSALSCFVFSLQEKASKKVGGNSEPIMINDPHLLSRDVPLFIDDLSDPDSSHSSSESEGSTCSFLLETFFIFPHVMSETSFPDFSASKVEYPL